MLHFTIQNCDKMRKSNLHVHAYVCVEYYIKIQRNIKRSLKQSEIKFRPTFCEITKILPKMSDKRRDESLCVFSFQLLEADKPFYDRRTVKGRSERFLGTDNDVSDE